MNKSNKYVIKELNLITISIKKCLCGAQGIIAYQLVKWYLCNIMQWEKK